jgi:hypothetical protein
MMAFDRGQERTDTGITDRLADLSRDGYCGGMKMNVGDVKSKCSIRGRVAFVLAIAEQFVESLKYSEKVYSLATKALDDAWKWEVGEQISGDQLDYYLENPEEESLAVYECMAPEELKPGFVAITSALAYVAWQAYKKDGIKRMSDSIHQVSETVIDQVVDFAKKSPGFDVPFVDCIAKYLVEKCGSSTRDGLGEPIAKASLMKAWRNQ